VLRIHFGVEDLARVQMVSGLGPLAESVFALDLLCRQRTAHHGWRRTVRTALGHRLPAVTDVLGRDPLSELLWLIDGPGDSIDVRRQPPDARSRQLAAAVSAFGRVAVLPYWQQVHRDLVAQRDIGARVLITRGVGHMLGMLNPAVRWNSPVLEVQSVEDRDVVLGGRGILLSPASFLTGRACVVIDATNRAAGRYVVAYSTPADDTVLSGPVDTGAQLEQALRALVGHTRAAALQVITAGPTTSELADRLNISQGGASKHATVLREAGLITTVRRRNTAVHSITPLGTALLRVQDELAVVPAGEPETGGTHRSTAVGGTGGW
jgi:DNA-binding transcriptional ArsR family regulator